MKCKLQHLSIRIISLTILALHSGFSTASTTDQSAANEVLEELLLKWNPSDNENDFDKMMQSANKEDAINSVSGLGAKKIIDLATNRPMAPWVLAREISKKFNGADEQTSLKLIKMAHLTTVYTTGGAGIENGGLSALRTFLNSPYPSVRLNAAIACQSFADTPGGSHPQIYNEALRFYVNAYNRESDPKIKEELKKLVRNYNPNYDFDPPRTLVARVLKFCKAALRNF